MSDSNHESESTIAGTGISSPDVSLPKLLVVDDDEQILKQVHWALSEEYQVLPARDRCSALGVFKKEEVAVVLLDLGLPPQPRDAVEGLLTLEEMIVHDPLAKVIIVSGNAERQNALLAIEKGAHDIFPKPIDLDELKVVLRRVFKRWELEKQSIDERSLAGRISFEDIVGSSSVMKTVFATVRKVADTDVPVLIQGESGTGKELIANAIHSLSKRNKGPFVAINCSAIPETLLESEFFGYEKGSFTGATTQRRGKLECAQGGTLFLDEIGDLAPELQVKILRFLQEKVIERVGGREQIHVDCRIVAATHRDLSDAVKNSLFREDLYFRLAVVKIHIPPLRERGADIIELAEDLVSSFSKELKKPPKKFSKTALEAMQRYSWPGNVRELQNRIKRALVLADGPFISRAELELAVPEEAAGEVVTLKDARQEFERELIARALRQFDGNVSKTAKALGISRPTLYELMERCQL
jgi:two-component system, NtrC family, response regulator